MSSEVRGPLPFNFSIERVFDPKTGQDEAYLKIGAETIHATFVRDPVVMRIAVLEKPWFPQASDYFSHRRRTCCCYSRCFSTGSTYDNRDFRGFFRW